MNRPILALALVIPAGLLVAQKQPPKGPTTASPATKLLHPLTLETADQVVAEGFKAMFGSQSPLPERPAETARYRLSVNDKQQVLQSISPPTKDWVTLKMAPGALAQIFKPQIDETWQMVSAGAIFGLTTTGMSAREAAKLMKRVRSFPEQLESVVVRLSTNPEEQLQGFSIHVSVRAVPGTWLAKVTKSLRPLAQGAPSLPAADPLIFVASALDPAAYDLISEPMVYLLSSMGARNKKDREERMAFVRKLVACQDGSFAMVGDPFGGGLQTISGIRDPKTLRPMVASEQYQKFTEAFGAMSSNIDAEFEAEDFTHRGVPVSRTTMTIDLDTPLNPAGDQITFTAVAGQYLVSTTSLTKKDARSLIDRALDRKVARAPIPAGALGMIRFKLVDLMDKIVPFNNPLAGDENAPQIVQMTFDSRNQALNFAIEIK